MGGTIKKLVGWTELDGTVHKGWAHYEFGKGVGDLPGNCQQCRAKCKGAAEQKRKHHLEVRRNLHHASKPVPPKQEFDPHPPCQKCPKWKLFPDNFGLDPRNETYVHLYRLASAEHRVGTFAGAFLLRTTTVEDVRGVLDEHAEMFPNFIYRRRAFEAVMALDRVATQVRSEQEEVERKREEEKAKAEAKKNAKR